MTRLEATAWVTSLGFVKDSCLDELIDKAFTKFGVDNLDLQVNYDNGEKNPNGPGVATWVLFRDTERRLSMKTWLVRTPEDRKQ